MEPSQWTIEALKEHFERRILDAEKAVLKAEENADKWRNNANEWRAAMSDRERDFLTRKEFYSIVGTVVVVVGLALTFLSFKGG